MHRFLDKAALLISIAASPFIIAAVCALLVIDRYAHSSYEFLLWGGTFFFFAVLIPLLFTYFLVAHGKITSMHIADRRQRTKPLAISLASAILLVAALAAEGAPWELIAITLVLIANGIVFLAITQFWKASIHAATLSGSITLFVLLFNTAFAYLFVLVPLVGWARMRRHRHNIWQTITGATVSAFVTVLLLLSLY